MNRAIKELNVKDRLVGVIKVVNDNYISLTDLARYANAEESKIPIQTWMRNKDVILSKVNYVVHTDSINKNFVPALTKEQKRCIYAEEAYVLNVALFGMTAKEWKEKNP